MVEFAGRLPPSPPSTTGLPKLLGPHGRASDDMTGHDACAAGRCPALVLCFAGWLSLPRLGVLAFAVPFALCAMLRCGRGVGGDVRHLPSNYGFSVVKGSLGGTCADDDPS